MNRWTLALPALMLLASCHGATVTNATMSQGRFVDANDRLMLVEVLQSRDVSNQVTLPLDPKIKVVMGGKEASLRQIPSGTEIQIWRDDKTRRIVRVETVGAGKK